MAIARDQRIAVITVTRNIRMIEGFDTIYHLADGKLSGYGAVATVHLDGDMFAEQA